MREITVYLHGAIAEAVTGPIKLMANTARQALSGLKMFPQLNPANTNDRYLCTAQGIETVADLDKPLESDVLHLHCQAKTNAKDIRGSGNNPYVRIIVGVVLVVVGFLVSATGWGANVGIAMMAAGIGLIFGGLAQILTPMKKPEEPEKSTSLNGYENTVRSGTPIPVIVGEHLHGGHIISMNVETLMGKDLNLKDFFFNPQALAKTSWTVLVDGSNGEPTNTKPPGRGPGGGGGGGDGTPPNQN